MCLTKTHWTELDRPVLFNFVLYQPNIVLPMEEYGKRAKICHIKMSLQPTVQPWQEPLYKLPMGFVKNSAIASGHHLTTLT